MASVDRDRLGAGARASQPCCQSRASRSCGQPRLPCVSGGMQRNKRGGARLLRTSYASHTRTYSEAAPSEPPLAGWYLRARLRYLQTAVHQLSKPGARPKGWLQGRSSCAGQRVMPSHHRPHSSPKKQHKYIFECWEEAAGVLDGRQVTASASLPVAHAFLTSISRADLQKRKNVT